MAKDPSGASSRSTPLSRLRLSLDYGLRFARRRPQIRRRRRRRHRLRSVQRREHLRDRAREGLVYRRPAQAQFRNGQAGGLSQGRALDANGRPFWNTSAVARGHRRRLSRDRCRGARASRSHCALIIGEGGSGGAIAIATANRVLMLENAIYSVISPEGAASILWRDTSKAQDAATSMKITADDMVRFGVIDQVVAEPPGGAHRDPATAIASAGEAISDALGELSGLDRETVRRQRREKFLAIGRGLA